MYGSKAKVLLQELQRSDWLPSYNVRRRSLPLQNQIVARFLAAYGPVASERTRCAAASQQLLR